MKKLNKVLLHLKRILFVEVPRETTSVSEAIEQTQEQAKKLVPKFYISIGCILGLTVIFCYCYKNVSDKNDVLLMEIKDI